MMNNKILILGKIPPPYYGPAIATAIIVQSELNKDFRLIHFDTRLNDSVGTIGQFSVLKIIKIFFMYYRFFKMLKFHRPALVLVPISQSPSGFFKDSIYILLARLFWGKVLIHLRGSNLKNVIDQSSFLFKVYVKLIYSVSNGVIVLGNNLRFIFHNYFSEDKIFVVPNGANFSFPPRALERSDRLRFLYFSNLLRSKGIKDVLKAISLLDTDDWSKFELHVVGNWNDNNFKKECCTFVSSNNLPCHFYSPLSGEKKFQMFIDSDVFIFPPREPEGHPWVIVEALAAGLPIITTDQGAISESVSHGENGFIVDSNSPSQIAKRLRGFLKNKESCKLMGAVSRSKYLESYTEDIMVDNLTKVFNILLGGK